MSKKLYCHLLSDEHHVTFCLSNFKKSGVKKITLTCGNKCQDPVPTKDYPLESWWAGFSVTKLHF